MRTNRMRAALAGILGMALIGVASPAMANGTPEATTTAEATATATATAEATATTTATTEATATATATATETTTPGVTGSETPTATPTVAETTGSPTPTPSSVTTTTGDPLIDSFLPVLPFKIDFGKVIDDPTDLDINPLWLSFTCTPDGPDWKIQNLADKSYGFGWFDTNLGGGILEIGPLQTLDIPSNALAVIASPWDGETKLILVTVPSVGVSNCEGTPAPAGGLGGGGGVTPVDIPVATPAIAVPGEPYYTG